MIKITKLSTGTTIQNNKAVLRFKKVQLLHEIADYGYIEGEVLPTDTANKQLTQDIVQGNNYARIVRHLDLAYTRVLRFLAPLADHQVGEDIFLDDVPDKREEYIVAMQVDSIWSIEKVEDLRNLIHNYLICYALYLWLSITADQSAEKWRLQALEMEEEIKIFKFGNGFYRRPFRPF